MLARKKSSVKGSLLPVEWTEALSRLLNETYKTQCEQNGRYFEVYGEIYSEELLVVVSYLSEKDPFSAPITCFLSCDPEHMNDVSKVKDTQNNYIEMIGLFFDEIFAQEEWREFEPLWQEVKHKNTAYFFKLSRENINLTIEANKLLGDDFLESEQETEDEEDH